MVQARRGLRTRKAELKRKGPASVKTLESEGNRALEEHEGGWLPGEEKGRSGAAFRREERRGWRFQVAPPRGGGLKL